MAATPSSDTFQEWILTLALLSVGSLYAAYYLKRVASKPIIACGNPKLQEFLQKHVPSIFQVYWPPFWCFQGHAHTILAVGFRIFISKTYRREVTETPDGGEIFLDWMDADDTSTINKARRPTVIIMPGLTGSSKESYIMHYADDMHRLGFRSVVFNQRGYGGSKLRTPRGFCAGNTEDIHFVVSHVKKLYPDAPVAVIGLSIGGIILLNYLAEYGDKAPLVGALPVSAAWDLMKSNRSLEENLNWLLFNSYLTNNLRNYLKSHAHMIEDKYDVEHVLQSRTIYQFDDRVTAKMFGYRNADHYYTEASPYGKIDKIKIPTLCLNAADDPFAPLKTLPLTSASKSSHVAIAVPQYGGHLGFMQGTVPVGKTLISKVLSEFMSGVFNHPDDFLQ